MIIWFGSTFTSFVDDWWWPVLLLLFIASQNVNCDVVDRILWSGNFAPKELIRGCETSDEGTMPSLVSTWSSGVDVNHQNDDTAAVAEMTPAAANTSWDFEFRRRSENWLMKWGDIFRERLDSQKVAAREEEEECCENKVLLMHKGIDLHAGNGL